jgi:uncharacterized protein (DUF924 family)
MMQAQTIIDFWFNQLIPKQWYVKDVVLDQQIIDSFSEVHQAVAAGECESWRETAVGRLAEIIVLDQFSRNMFRGSSLSFAYDSQALTLAQEAIRQGFDHQLSAVQKQFVYMPYMHSESLLVHQKAVVLFDQQGLEDNLDYEYKHLAILERFGRYPHRNQVLGRESTAEEIEFLQQPGSSF